MILLRNRRAAAGLALGTTCLLSAPTALPAQCVGEASKSSAALACAVGEEAQVKRWALALTRAEATGALSRRAPGAAREDSSGMAPVHFFGLSAWDSPPAASASPGAVFLPGFFTAGASLAAALHAFPAGGETPLGALGESSIGELFVLGPGEGGYIRKPTMTPGGGLGSDGRPAGDQAAVGAEQVAVEEAGVEDVLSPVQAQVVPEPLSIALLGTGLLAFGAARVSRHRKERMG